MLGQTLKVQSIDLCFGDFKCLDSPYPNTPDIILKNSNRELKVVGELKVHWVAEHKIGNLYADKKQL